MNGKRRRIEVVVGGETGCMRLITRLRAGRMETAQIDEGHVTAAVKMSRLIYHVGQRIKNDRRSPERDRKGGQS